jgi:hypothetical protein
MATDSSIDISVDSLLNNIGLTITESQKQELEASFEKALEERGNSRETFLNIVGGYTRDIGLKLDSSVIYELVESSFNPPASEQDGSTQNINTGSPPPAETPEFAPYTDESLQTVSDEPAPVYTADGEETTREPLKTVSGELPPAPATEGGETAKEPVKVGSRGPAPATEDGEIAKEPVKVGSREPAPTAEGEETTKEPVKAGSGEPAPAPATEDGEIAKEPVKVGSRGPASTAEGEGPAKEPAKVGSGEPAPTAEGEEIAKEPAKAGSKEKEHPKIDFSKIPKNGEGNGISPDGDVDKGNVVSGLWSLAVPPALQDILWNDKGEFLLDGIEKIAGLDVNSDEGWNGLPKENRETMKYFADFLLGKAEGDISDESDRAHKILTKLFERGNPRTMTAEEVQGYLNDPASMPSALSITLDSLPPMDSKAGIQLLAKNKDTVDEADGGKDGNFSVLGLVAISQNAGNKYTLEMQAAANAVLKDQGMMGVIDGEFDSIYIDGESGEGAGKQNVRDGLFSGDALDYAATASSKDEIDPQSDYWTEQLYLPSLELREKFAAFSIGSILDGYAPRAINSDGRLEERVHTYGAVASSKPLAWMIATPPADDPPPEEADDSYTDYSLFGT